MAITELTVRNTKLSDKPVKMTDGNGMHLLITTRGSRYWRFQYRFAGKQRILALGVYPEVSLSEPDEEETKPTSSLPISYTRDKSQ